MIQKCIGIYWATTMKATKCQGDCVSVAIYWKCIHYEVAHIKSV